MQITRIEPGNKELPRLKKVAAYARVSSDKDAMLQSLSAQVSYYSGLISQTPEWEHMGVFIDEALSGTKDNRPEFQRLLAECRTGSIDLIITKSISRLARNTVTILESVRELKALEVDIFFERENIHSLSAEGELMLTILSSYAQEESRSVSENCKWRIRRDFKEGRPNTGKMLGYHLVNGVLNIIPEEAELVKAIFEDYLSGLGATAIAKKYLLQGVKISINGIWYILRNEKYSGNMLLQKTFRPDHISKKNCLNKGQLPMYFVENSHEAIIPKKVFDKVQLEIARRAAIYQPKLKQLTKYPFTGLIKCGFCSASYKRKHSRAGTKYDKIIWICPTFNSYGKEKCSSQQIPEDVLMEKTAEALKMQAFDESALYQSIKEILVLERNKLIFCLIDGQRRELEWHTSRRDSWSPEMKEIARQRQLEGSSVQ